MSAYNRGNEKADGDGLPRVRMLSCLHALFTQLHDSGSEEAAADGGRFWRGDIRRGSSLPHPVGSLPHPVGSLPHPVGSLPHPVGSLPHPVGSLPHPVGSLPHPVGSLPHPVGAVSRPILNPADLDGLEKAVRILHLRYWSSLRPLTRGKLPIDRCAVSRPILDPADLDGLEKAVRILHLRYRSCLRPLTRGKLPSRTELKEMRLSAQAMGVRAAMMMIDKVPKGDPRRVPLFAFRTFALRAELDSQALRSTPEPAAAATAEPAAATAEPANKSAPATANGCHPPSSSPSPSPSRWDVDSYRIAAAPLEDLLEDLTDEVQAVWEASQRTVYDVAVSLAPVLAQYALLGRAVQLVIQENNQVVTAEGGSGGAGGSGAGVAVPAVGDELILWDDGLDDVRDLFLPDRREANLNSSPSPSSSPSSSSASSAAACSFSSSFPLGATVRIDSMSDFSWFVAWNGTSPVDSIPSEVSVKRLLHSIGAPSSQHAMLRSSDKSLLMAVTLPEVRFEAERRVGEQLAWAVEGGARLEMKQGRGQFVGSGGSVGGSGGAGGLAGGGGGGGRGRRGGEGEWYLEELEPAKAIPYEEVERATQGWAEEAKLGEGGSAVVYRGCGADGQLWAVKRGKKGGISRRKDYEKEVRQMWFQPTRNDTFSPPSAAPPFPVPLPSLSVLSPPRPLLPSSPHLSPIPPNIHAVSQLRHANLVRLLGFCEEREGGAALLPPARLHSTSPPPLCPLAFALCPFNLPLFPPQKIHAVSQLRHASPVRLLLGFWEESSFAAMQRLEGGASSRLLTMQTSHLHPHASTPHDLPLSSHCPPPPLPVTPSPSPPPRHPLPVTPSPSPSPRHPLPVTLSPSPSPRHPLPVTPSPSPSPRHPLPVTLSPSPSPRHPLPVTLSPSPSPRHPLPVTLSPSPSPRHPLPVTLSPSPPPLPSSFPPQIHAVSQLRHPNLVRLLGYCEEREELLLVYEFVPNGNLRQHINPIRGEAAIEGKPGGMLSFDKRLEVALGVAEALQYMHGCHPAIIHRDVKTLNVFLDNDLHPKLGDFGNVKEINDESTSPRTPEWSALQAIWIIVGSSKDTLVFLSPSLPSPLPQPKLGNFDNVKEISNESTFPSSSPLYGISLVFPAHTTASFTPLPPVPASLASQLSQPKLGDFGNVKEINDESTSPTHTRVVGTPGYLDPQYCQTSIVSDRSDVYSFGVVLLELITGKAPVLKESDDAGERMALAKWATPAICSGHTDSVADPVLLESSTPQALQAVGSLAAMCVQRLPKDRPAMGEVVRRLKSIRQQALAAAATASGSLRGFPTFGRAGGSITSPDAAAAAAAADGGGGASTPRPSSAAAAFPMLSPRIPGGINVFQKDFWRPKFPPVRSKSDMNLANLPSESGSEGSQQEGSRGREGGGAEAEVPLSAVPASMSGLVRGRKGVERVESTEEGEEGELEGGFGRRWMGGDESDRESEGSGGGRFGSGGSGGGGGGGGSGGGSSAANVSSQLLSPKPAARALRGFLPHSRTVSGGEVPTTPTTPTTPGGRPRSRGEGGSGGKRGLFRRNPHDQGHWEDDELEDGEEEQGEHRQGYARAHGESSRDRPGDGHGRGGGHGRERGVGHGRERGRERGHAREPSQEEAQAPTKQPGKIPKSRSLDLASLMLGLPIPHSKTKEEVGGEGRGGGKSPRGGGAKSPRGGGGSKSPRGGGAKSPRGGGGAKSPLMAPSSPLPETAKKFLSATLGKKNKMKEIQALVALQHANLAEILGYALEKDDVQIAYDLPPNSASLENYLFPEGVDGDFLPLRVRVKVAIGVAKGLAYLHSKSVVHGNLMCCNVMLDSSYTALLTGYGLAAILAKGSSKKILKGAEGMGKDAFDFGVVLFSLLTGRQGAHSTAQQHGAEALFDWAEPYTDDLARSAECGSATRRMVVRMLDVLAKECMQDDPRRSKGWYRQTAVVSCGGEWCSAVKRMVKGMVKSMVKSMVVRMLDVLAKECMQDDPRCRPSMEDLVVRLFRLQDSLRVGRKHRWDF
ncbi:unnamed protein product [Closterium sp. NIES-65]|nr:unnamed protein product [Closterium sp. NIES-65]